MTTRRIGLVRAVVAVAVVAGLVDTFALVPLTQAPGTPISGTYAALAAAGELAWVIPWPVLWAALVVGALVALDRSVSTGRLGAGPLLLVAGGLGFLFCVSQFAMVMWISNHLPPYEGGDTLTGGTFYGDLSLLLASVATVGGLILLGVSATRRRLSF